MSTMSSSMSPTPTELESPSVLNFLGLKEAFYKNPTISISERGVDETASESRGVLTETDLPDEGPTLSGYELSDTGVMQPRWSEMENIPSMIVSTGPSEVVMDCLVSEERLQFEQRTFPRRFLENRVPVEVGQLVYVRYRMRPGEVRFTFERGDGLFSSDLFRSGQGLESLRGLGLDKERARSTQEDAA